MNDSILYWYIIALINSIGVFNVSGLSRIVPNITHDKFTRLLNKEIESQMLLLYCIQRIHPLTKGCLIIDDTWLPKCFSRFFRAVRVQRSGRYKVKLPGITVVMLIWTDGVYRIPISVKIWIKGKKTKPEIAKDMISQVRNKIKYKPQYITFDSHYATKGILKLLDGYGWVYVTNVPRSRTIKGIQVYSLLKGGYAKASGKAWYGGFVQVFRNKDRFYICNRLTYTRSKVMSMWKSRVIIEEVFRILKQCCGFVGCQMRSELAYENHLYLCLISFLVLEATRIRYSKQGKIISIYELRKQAILGDQLFIPPVIFRLSRIA